MVEATESPDWTAFAEQAAGFGAPLSGEQVTSFQEYLSLLQEWNQKFNLTAISQPQAIVTKHFLDSLTVASAVDFDRAKTLVDVGTGAGFPGLALKIAFPHLQVTLLDALRKRLRFLERVTEALQLEDVTFVHCRAEDAVLPKRFQACGLKQSLRERFDVVTARAVAPMDVLAEWTLPYAKVGGWVVAMKGPDVDDEVNFGQISINLLGGGKAAIKRLSLPSLGEEGQIGRSLVTIRKEENTPANFPRLPGSARKQPLGTVPPRRQRQG